MNRATRNTRSYISAPRILFVCLLLALFAAPGYAQQKLSVHWEELTGPDFVHAIAKAQGTCLLPIGIVEKHGPQLPLGTDLISVRYAALHAAEQEYAVVFPPYYFGQIFEARHEPGTLAYSAKMQMELLQETTDEMARNGCKKVIIVNGHGGNESFLPYFAQTQLAARHDYVVYVLPLPDLDVPGRPPHKSTVDMHAGETETSRVLVTRPDLVHMDRAKSESGADEDRLNFPGGLYTGIWWYAKFPNHYAGDASVATKELGEFDMKTWVSQIDAAIRAVKADSESLKLQNEFFDKAAHPIDTPQ